MESQPFPVYYHPGSLLDVEVAAGSGIRQFEVVRPITPFGSGQCLVVQEKTSNHGDPDEEIILKVYDPRFMHGRRKWMKKDWDAESEADAVEWRKTHPPPEPITSSYVSDIRYEDRSLDQENWLFLDAYLHHSKEVRAYGELQPLQGKGIPRFLGHGKLCSNTLQQDPATRYIEPKILLLEYIPNSMTLQDADVSMIRPDLIRSLLDTVEKLQLYDVIHAGLHAGNFLFAPDRALVIDFGRAIFRDGYSDEDWETLFVCEGDPRGVRVYLQQKLGIKSVDDYLKNIV